MYHVTKYCNMIGPHCTVWQNKACMCSSPDPSLSCGSGSGLRDYAWVWLSVVMHVKEGQVKNAETEMEVRKPKYRSEKKSRLSVFSAFLTHECVCWGLIDKRGLNLCDVRAGSWTAASIAITNCALCMWKPDPNQDKRRVHEPTMWALCSWNVLTVMQMRVLS